MKTDWEKIAIEIGSNTSSATQYVERAFEQILGEEWIKQAVDSAIACVDGGDLAMGCLRHISSEKAADYAYSIYKSDPDPENKRMAVWLIKHLAVAKSYDWVEEFLTDKNAVGWGIGVLDQLIWCNRIDYEDEKVQVDYLFELAIKNSNGALKENVDFIKEYLKSRAEME